MPATWRRNARDRTILLTGVASVTAIGWLALARMSATMVGTGAQTMPGMMMASSGAPRFGYGMTLAMWIAMMIAMMAPAAGPGASAYLALARRRSRDGNPVIAVAGFLMGYLAAWLGYAVLGAAAQSVLARAMLLTPPGAIASTYLAAGVLIVAGAYQLTSLKRACVTRCRSPLLQLMSIWRDGALGAFRLGLTQGSWCVACCWALMALMLVVGVMNLVWMAIIAAFTLAEKLVPARWHLDLVAGVLLIAAGAWMALATAG